MKYFLRSTLVFLACVLVAQLDAQTLGPCPTESLAAYENQSECFLGQNANGGLDVFNFNLFFGPADAAAGILITPVPGPGGIGGGFSFSGFPSSHDPSDPVTYIIDYSYII